MMRLLLVLIMVLAAGASRAQQVYPSPDAAASAFVDAVQTSDDNAFATILGPAWRELMPADDAEGLRGAFLAAWKAGHRIVPDGDSMMLVEVGSNGWTLPIPLTKKGEGWRFDFEEGRIEMRARRIGRNELIVLQVLLSLIDAQREYAERDPTKSGRVHYARRLWSSPGKKDGLFWEVAPGEPQSPIGPLLGKAQAASGSPDGFHGYRYRLLYAQGPHAPGGAIDYLVKDRMLGFALIAWPVRYGESGVMTFITSHDGQVYEQDLGPRTLARAAAITLFDPDGSWEKVEP